MSRNAALLTFAGALALAGSAHAQGRQELQAERAPSPMRDAGIYHLASNTWTRSGAGTAAFGPDIVYSNTAPTSYFTSAGGSGGFAPGSTNFDEGGLPGTTNAGPFAGVVDRDTYVINCVSIAYCDLGAPGSSGFELSFYESYTPCSFDPSPDATVVAVGLPAAGGCWTVMLDLTGNEFCLSADGGDASPGWDGDPLLDSFGWSYRYAGADGAPGNSVGFMLAGNPLATDPSYIVGGLPLDGSNTYYGQTLCPGVGTGYLSQDFWWLEDPMGTNSNCYFFGFQPQNTSCAGPAYPTSSYHIELGASTGPCPGPPCGSSYCLSNPNSRGLTSCTYLLGSPEAALDDARIEAVDLPFNAFGFFITSQTQGFVANPNGSQGNLCVLGDIGRFVAPGQIKDSGPTGTVSLDTNLGEWSTSAIPTPMGSYAAMTGITSNFQLWHRDVVGGTATSNFSSATTVTWF